MYVCLFICQQPTKQEPSDNATIPSDRSPGYGKRKSPDWYSSTRTDTKKSRYSSEQSSVNPAAVRMVPQDEDTRISAQTSSPSYMYDPFTREVEHVQLPSLMSLPVKTPPLKESAVPVSTAAKPSPSPPTAVTESRLPPYANFPSLAQYIQQHAVSIPGPETIASAAAQPNVLGLPAHLIQGYLPAAAVYDQQQLYSYHQSPYQTVLPQTAAVPLVPYELPSPPQVATSRYTPSPAGSGTGSVRNLVQDQINIILGDQPQPQQDHPSTQQLRNATAFQQHQPAAVQHSLTSTYTRESTTPPHDHLEILRSAPATDSYALPWESYVQRGMIKNRFPILVSNVSNPLLESLDCPSVVYHVPEARALNH